MHTAMILASIATLLALGALGLQRLRFLQGWSLRRWVQLLILAAPVVVFEMSLDGLHLAANQVCYVGTAQVSYRLDAVLPSAVALCGLGALVVGLLRHLLARWFIARQHALPAPELQALADGFAAQFGGTKVRVMICPSAQPIALTCGVWRPTVLLSTALLAQLDPREREAVVAHELSHVLRRDYGTVWLASVLRDAFWYVPTSRLAYGLLVREKELAADDLAIVMTRRRLALASALAKVLAEAMLPPTIAAGQQLTAPGSAIEERIRRLLDESAPPAIAPSKGVVVLVVGLVLLAGVFLMSGADLAALRWEPAGCTPLFSFVRLFWAR